MSDAVETISQNPTEQQPSPKRASSLSMIITLGSVAMLSGLLVVLTWQLTLHPIKENQRIMIEKAIFQVVPGARSRQSYTITNSGLVNELQKNGLQFYAAYDDKGNLKGVAAEAGAQGYADMVRLLYGYDPECQCVRGFSIIKMAETPGLGDKILTDKNFLANFDALDARLNSEQTALENSIVTVKSGSKKNPWEIDAISGATITSKAVGKAINLGAQDLLPKLIPLLPQLQKQLQKQSQTKSED